MARVSGAAAAKGDLEKAVNDVVKDAYGIIFGVSTGIAVVFIAWHLVCIMTTGDPQTTRMHVQTIKKVAIAWAVLNCLGAIYATVSHIVKGNEYKF